MTPEQAAHDSASAVVGLPGRYMNDPSTFEHGSEFGLVGMDFYVAGRGGVLGEVPAGVVAAALVFFAPAVITEAWERSAAVTTRRGAAEEWAACGHAWARKHFGDGPDYVRLAEVLRPIIDNASVAGAPVFAAWKTLIEPSDPKSLVMHRLNALRELRGALHGAAIMTVGLTPSEAIMVRTPGMARLFGWPEPYPDPEPARDRWQLADARTDRMIGRSYAAINAEERAELVAITAQVVDALQ